MDIVQQVLIVLIVLIEVLGDDYDNINDYSHYNVHHTNMCPPNGYRPAFAMDFKTAFINNTKGNQTKIITKVTIVDEQGEILFDTFVKPKLNISDITDLDIKTGDEFIKVRQTIIKMISCRLLIGHNLYECLDLFKIQHPYYLLRDTTYFCNNCTNITHVHDTLKTIAKEFVFIDIDENNHNTTENAITAMKIYKKYQREWEIYILGHHRTAFALDCEMVECERPNKLKLEAVVRISVVDHVGDVVYDKLIKPELPVTDYRTFVTGIYKENLTNAANLTEEKDRLGSLLKGHIVVGHAVGHDLSLLGLNHPFALCRDSSQFITFRRKFPHKRKPSLKELAKHLLNMTIQVGHHDSREDAHAAMMLYLKYRQDWDEDAMKQM